MRKKHRKITDSQTKTLLQHPLSEHPYQAISAANLDQNVNQPVAATTSQELPDECDGIDQNVNQPIAATTSQETPDECAGSDQSADIDYGDNGEDSHTEEEERDEEKHIIKITSLMPTSPLKKRPALSSTVTRETKKSKKQSLYSHSQLFTTPKRETRKFQAVKTVGEQTTKGMSQDEKNLFAYFDAIKKLNRTEESDLYKKRLIRIMDNFINPGKSSFLNLDPDTIDTLNDTVNIALYQKVTVSCNFLCISCFFKQETVDPLNTKPDIMSILRRVGNKKRSEIEEQIEDPAITQQNF